MINAETRLSLIEKISRKIPLLLLEIDEEDLAFDWDLGSARLAACQKHITPAVAWAVEDARATLEAKEDGGTEASKKGDGHGRELKPSTKAKPDAEEQLSLPSLPSSSKSPKLPSSISPDTSSEPPKSSSQPTNMASFAGLPTELKILMVEMIVEVELEMAQQRNDDEEEDEVKFATQVMRERYEKSPLLSIALVNKEYSKLAQEYLWESLDLRECRLDDLSYLLHLLPKYRHHIHSLQVSTGPPPSHGNALFKDAVVDIRQLLVALVILLIPKLESVEANLSTPRHEPIVWDALSVHGGHLGDVALEATDLQGNERELARLVESFLVIDQLRLEDFTSFDMEGREALHAAIAGRPLLKALSLLRVSFVTDELAGKEWASSLLLLELAECSQLSLLGWMTLVKRHASTLETLDLDDTPLIIESSDERAITDGDIQLILPKLDSLVLTTDHTCFFLELFKKCSLKDVTIGYCPNMEMDEWLDFVGHHEKTLELVLVEAGGDWNEDDQLDFLGWCHSRDIGCLVEPESDYSDEEYSDEFSDEEEDSDGWVDDEDAEVDSNQDWQSENEHDVD